MKLWLTHASSPPSPHAPALQAASLKRSLDEEHDLAVSLRGQLATAQSSAEEKLASVQLQLQESCKAEHLMRAQVDKAEAKMKALVEELEDKSKRLKRQEAGGRRAGELEQQVGWG